MSRTLRNVLGVGVVASVLGAGCSGDADGGDGAADRASGQGGSGSDVASGGAGGSTPSGSSGSAGGGGSANPATYTAARACDSFGRASCAKAVECGLVLAQTGTTLVCAQCDALSLGIIQQRCVQDAPGDKDAAAVDRCVASISAQACADACANPDANDCEVFGQLSSDTSNALVCDARCAQ
jgi:hypothetical protein